MKDFWEGFEKQALLKTRGSELALGTALGGLVPLGTTGHTVLGDRPEGHSRGEEWLKRVGGGELGGMAEACRWW